MRTAAIFIAVNGDEEDIKEDDIKHLIPKRKWNKGAKPGKFTKEINKPANRTEGKTEEQISKDEEQNEEESKFETMKKPTKEEERKILAKVIEISINKIKRVL